MSNNSNPYHTYVHLMDVTQACYVFCNQFQAKAIYFDDVDIFSLLIGSLIHDLDHPGTTNAYQVNSHTDLAVLYNDKSILENHHCALAFQLLKDSATNIFQDVDCVTSKRIRRQIIEVILSTDIAVHFSMLPELEECIHKYSLNLPIIELKENAKKINAKDKLVLLKTILHAADISNPLRPWYLCKKWSDLVMQEFFAQGDRERNEGLPISMNMDRYTTQQDETSLNFIDFIVAPLYFLVIQFLPNTKEILKLMISNRNEWNILFQTRLKSTLTLLQLQRNSTEVNLTTEQSILLIEENLIKFERRTNKFLIEANSLLNEAEIKLQQENEEEKNVE